MILVEVSEILRLLHFSMKNWKKYELIYKHRLTFKIFFQFHTQFITVEFWGPASVYFQFDERSMPGRIKKNNARVVEI